MWENFINLIVLVFILGFNLNQAPINEKSDIAFNNLQQEVSSLSTVLAISMLQKSSASERLSGVAFSRQTDLSNPLLVIILNRLFIIIFH